MLYASAFALLAASCATTPQPDCSRCEGECRPTDAEACKNLGDKARKADPVDYDRSAVFYDRACRNRSGEACARLGLLSQDGQGRPDDDAAALAYYTQACDLGAGVGCFNAGLMFRDGHGVVRDVATADTWFSRAEQSYRRSCEANQLTWCMNLGVLYELGAGVPADGDHALQIYQDACAKGHQDACANAALSHIEGRGVPRDPVAGLATLQAACDAGSELACGALGRIYVLGTPEQPPDVAKGVLLLERACAAGEAKPCGFLGAHYGGGDAPLDLAKGAKYNLRACDLGDSTSCMAMAFAQATPGEAEGWFERACGMGMGDACFWVGKIRFEGGASGVGDLEGALAAFHAGCRLGSIDGCGALVLSGRDLPVAPEDRAPMLRQICSSGVAAACSPGTP